MTKQQSFVIREVIQKQDIIESGKIIRRSFSTVVREFGLTRANCPSHPAFLPLAKLIELKSKGVKLFGGFLGNEQVGFVAIEKSDTKGLYCVEKLSVLPPLRHQGYGRQLVAFAQEYVKVQNGRRISIGIINGHSVLKNWYQRLGFKETGTRKFAHLPFMVGYMESKID